MYAFGTYTSENPRFSVPISVHKNMLIKKNAIFINKVKHQKSMSFFVLI